MIITRICNGLGNQLFQYAVGRQLAERHGTELKLDIENYSLPPWRTELQQFPRFLSFTIYPSQQRLPPIRTLI